MTRREKAALGSLVAFYLLGLGVLIGVVTERVRFDGVHAEILTRLVGAHTVRAGGLEREGNATRLDVGAAQSIEQALSRGDVAGADRAWRAAYTEAMRSRDWLALADLGDAALRIGNAAGERGGSVPRARDAYLAALVRARADRSVDGITRMRLAFIRLGDHEVAQQCAIIAEAMSTRRIDAPTANGRAQAAERAPWMDP